MTYIITQPCVDVLDKACIEECPVDCIYEGERMLYIHPDECVDCGACEPVCPVEAIYYEDDLPQALTPHLADNEASLPKPCRVGTSRWDRRAGPPRSVLSVSTRLWWRASLEPTML